MAIVIPPQPVIKTAGHHDDDIKLEMLRHGRLLVVRSDVFRHNPFDSHAAHVLQYKNGERVGMWSIEEHPGEPDTFRAIESDAMRDYCFGDIVPRLCDRIATSNRLHVQEIHLSRGVMVVVHREGKTVVGSTIQHIASLLQATCERRSPDAWLSVLIDPDQVDLRDALPEKLRRNYCMIGITAQRELRAFVSA